MSDESMPDAVDSALTGRRRFIHSSAALLAGLCLPPSARAARSAGDVKRLKLYHTHTGEFLDRVFWADGRYLPGALAEISTLLRDHRTNQVAPIAPQLLSLLERIASLVGALEGFHVISGYRSPQTNQLLADRSRGVARRSLHMAGKAIDIRIPGRSLIDVRDAALSVRGGGVGFYPESEFVHVDIGRVRSW
jgi:uncharacterized protein YcbK (DUF882 family)